MKSVFRYLILLFVTPLAFISCEDMDSTYKEFIVPGGITYPGKALYPVAHPGNNRIKISWLNSSDPSVTKGKIFWNNYTDSLEVEISETSDTISVIIDPLPEKSYSFIIKTYDSKGNSSVPVEVLSPVYGANYQASLLNRPVIENELGATGNTLTIQWAGADISNGAFATEVKYTDTLGANRIERFPITEEISTLSDIKQGTTYGHRTVFFPDSLSIDTFYTDFMENTLYLLNKSNWSIVDFSSEHPHAAGIFAATHAIDGDPGTHWHTLAGGSYYPDHYITVDMGAEFTITTFELFRKTGDNRACDTFQLLVSTDNVAWSDLGSFNFNRLIDDGQFYNIPSSPKARYFKFVGLTGPQDYMVIGEINAYGF